MSKYGNFLYGQSVYGQKSRLAFSVYPFSAVALDYSSIQLNWTAPVGGYTAFRILRNQEGYSETSEDGTVIYEEFGIDSSSGNVSITTFNDGVDNPLSPKLVPGKFVYYRVWIIKASDNVWYPAGDTVTLLPSSHPTYGPNKSVLQTTHDKMMHLVPKVFTSISQSPVDEVSSDTDLYRFLQGFSFTVDEYLTMADSLLPNYSESKTSPNIIGVKADQLGLTREPTISIKHQKRMLKDAIYMYQHKGTENAISALVENTTGYAPTVSASPNLMLSSADSTFNGGLGFWLPIGNCTITLENVNPVTSEAASIDKVYSAKVVVGTGGASISNGADYPVTRGIPVEGGQEYGFSYYIQKSTSTGTVVPSINWYDIFGTFISTSTGSSVTATTTWAKPVTLFTATAPDNAAYASVAIKFNATGTYYVDMFQFATSDILEYNEARAAYIFLAPSKSNLITNPSFEIDTYGWIVTSGTISRVSATPPKYDLTGSNALSLSAGTVLINTNTGSGAFPSDSYVTGSLYTKATSGTEDITLTVFLVVNDSVVDYEVVSNVATLTLSGGSNLKVGSSITVSNVGIPFDGAHTVTAVDGNTISFAVSHSDIAPTPATTGVVQNVVDASVTQTITSTDWTRVQVTEYIPAEILQENLSFRLQVSGTFANNVLIDAVQLESGFLATDYFDGDYGTERDALWAFNPGQSPSFLYPNKIVNVSRLTAELSNFLPQDTPYIVSSYSGTEASGYTS
jgi:hypothetical protein